MQVNFIPIYTNVSFQIKSEAFPRSISCCQFVCQCLSLLQDIVFASRNRQIIHFSRQFGACSPIKSDDFELTFLIAINDKNIGCSAATGICFWGHRFIHDLECREQVNFSFPTMHHITGSGQPHLAMVLHQANLRPALTAERYSSPFPLVCCYASDL